MFNSQDVPRLRCVCVPSTPSPLFLASLSETPAGDLPHVFVCLFPTDRGVVAVLSWARLDLALCNQGLVGVPRSLFLQVVDAVPILSGIDLLPVEDLKEHVKSRGKERS